MRFAYLLKILLCLKLLVRIFVACGAKPLTVKYAINGWIRSRPVYSSMGGGRASLF